MEEYYKTCNLGEEISKLKVQEPSSFFENKLGEVRQQSLVVKGVKGVLKLAGSPHYQLLLECGSHILPLTPVDIARNLCHWISAVGKTVLISQLLVIREDFQFFKEDKLEYHHLFVKWEDVVITKDFHVKSNMDFMSINLLKTEISENIIQSTRTCRILIHHVSLPFYVDSKAPAICLAFISYFNRNNLESKLWLILKAEQVAWREFLIPNREYLVHFPSHTDKFFFDQTQKPLNKFFEVFTRELQVMFHHRLLFSKPSLNGSIVPTGSKILLCRNTAFSKYVSQFSPDPLSVWYSACEANNSNTDLVTFYGKVNSVIYDEEKVHKACYLCVRAKPCEPILQAPKNNTDETWLNPWKTGLSLGEKELIALPTIVDGHEKMETGVPGRMVQIIKMHDVVTGEEQSIYIKHSYLPNCQRPLRLSSGMVVCISHLNRRCSDTGNYYYITTVLSTFRVLDYDREELQCEGWGLYGLRHFTSKLHEKTWGVLEAHNLYKVVISAKCNNCGSVFYKGTCSKHCSGAGLYTSTAYAISWINVIHDKNTVYMEKVLLKDDFVRTLLCIPEAIWEQLLEIAVQEEIVAFTNQDLNGPVASTGIASIFQIYCCLSRPKGKFYISVKKMSTFEDEVFYFCIHLEPINTQRLKKVAGLVKAVCSN